MPRTDVLSLTIKIEDENLQLKFPRLRQAMRGLGDIVIKEAQAELRTQDKVVSGDLYNSLTYTIDTGADQMTLVFGAGVPYWDFVNQGVRGTQSSAKAPNSPYQFGTGSYTGSQTLRGGIDRWVVQKPIAGIRDMKTGRFVPRKQLVRMISRIVWTTGIKPSNYFTLALDRGWQKAKKRIGLAVGLDVNQFMSDNFSREYVIDIEL